MRPDRQALPNLHHVHQAGIRRVLQVGKSTAPSTEMDIHVSRCVTRIDEPILSSSQEYDISYLITVGSRELHVHEHSPRYLFREGRRACAEPLPGFSAGTHGVRVQYLLPRQHSGFHHPPRHPQSQIPHSSNISVYVTRQGRGASCSVDVASTLIMKPLPSFLRFTISAVLPTFSTCHSTWSRYYL